MHTARAGALPGDYKLWRALSGIAVEQRRKGRLNGRQARQYCQAGVHGRCGRHQSVLHWPHAGTAPLVVTSGRVDGYNDAIMEVAIYDKGSLFDSSARWAPPLGPQRMHDGTPLQRPRPGVMG